LVEQDARHLEILGGLAWNQSKTAAHGCKAAVILRNESALLWAVYPKHSPISD
jgi:hypothetical protein